MTRRITLLLLFLLAALPQAAQTRHQITKIEFRNTRIPTAILRAESTLVEDRTYTDEELELAVARIRRLPFVYDAYGTLEGTTLVIDVADEHRFFYDFDVAGQRNERFDQLQVELGLGGRLYVGSAGVVQAALGNVVTDSGDDAGGIALRYTQYALGGTRLFATVALRREHFTEGGESDFSPEIVIGLPLSLRQTIRVVAAHDGFTSSRTFAALSRPLHNKFDNDQVAVRWTFDTTRDPLFATRGLVVDVAPGWEHNQSLFESFSGRTIFSSASDRNALTLRTDLTRYFQQGARSSFFAGLTGDAAGGTIDNTTNGRANSFDFRSGTATLTGGWAHNFHDADRMARRHSRIEVALTATEEWFDNGRSRDSTRTYGGSLAYVYRHAWGRLRLAALYRAD